MNIGDCPYEDCQELLFLAVPDITPAFAKIKCKGCQRFLWYRFSRIDPEAWTIADFPFEVNEKTHTIKELNDETL